MMPITSSHNLAVTGLAIQQNDATRILVANHTPELINVSVQNISGTVRVSYLDESNVAEAMHHPEAFRSRNGERLEVSDGRLELSLKPYGLARIDNVRLM
ncbi:MAG: hypothetical protein WKF84_05900 [Pyrinomonadaceae bacterium]